MGLTIALAYCGWGKVEPNPMVGCVILDRDSKLLSTAYHEVFGGPHAEVNAFAGLSNEALAGAQVFVSLEPCSHHGKTPPCAELVKTYPIKELCIGLLDPNPLVAGKGMKAIEEAGITVSLYDGVFKEELERLTERFFYYITNKKSFWAAKIATSLDAVMALNSGESQWITNETSREKVHFLRAAYAAIAVGKKTIERDNPRLNVRHKGYPDKKQKLLIFTRSSDDSFLLDKKVLEYFETEDIILLVSSNRNSRSQTKRGYHLIEFDQSTDTWKDQLSECLFVDHNIHSVFVEPGPGLLSFLLEARLLQKLYHFQAPCLLGSSHQSFTKQFFVNQLSDRFELKPQSLEELRGDLFREYRLTT